MKKLLTMIFIAALFGVTAPFAEAKTSAESANIQQRRNNQTRHRQEHRQTRQRRDQRRDNQRYDRSRRDNGYYQNRRYNNRRNNNRYQNRRYNNRTRTVYQTRYVRRGYRVYKETYRITYLNGRTYTRLISRVRAR